MIYPLIFFLPICEDWALGLSEPTGWTAFCTFTGGRVTLARGGTYV